MKKILTLISIASIIVACNTDTPTASNITNEEVRYVYDTTYVIDTVTTLDTLLITKDSVVIDTRYDIRYDTLLLLDTTWRSDTVVVNDTIHSVRIDTVALVRDTVFVDLSSSNNKTLIDIINSYKGFVSSTHAVFYNPNRFNKPKVANHTSTVLTHGLSIGEYDMGHGIWHKNDTLVNHYVFINIEGRTANTTSYYGNTLYHYNANNNNLTWVNRNVSWYTLSGTISVVNDSTVSFNNELWFACTNVHKINRVSGCYLN